MNEPHARPPVVARYRMRYSRLGRMRFSSHRDFQRALERAIRRAGVPIAFSHGFNPRPKISYANAAPTGVASHAEYVEFGVTEPVDPEATRRRISAALPDGLDIVELVEARTPDFVLRLEASWYRITMPGIDVGHLETALAAFRAAPAIEVERTTKTGRRVVDARAAVAWIAVAGADAPDGAATDTGAESAMPPGSDVRCAILDVVVRQVTPGVRPDDVLNALRRVADLDAPVTTVVTRRAQGPLVAEAAAAMPTIGDPLAADRDEADVDTRRL